MPQVPPPVLADEKLANDAERAIDEFRELRGQEPLEVYNDYFDKYRDSVENLLEES